MAAWLYVFWIMTHRPCARRRLRGIRAACIARAGMIASDLAAGAGRPARGRSLGCDGTFGPSCAGGLSRGAEDRGGAARGEVIGRFFE
jgi:hypothetical protein